MLQRALELTKTAGLLKTAEMAHSYLYQICEDMGDLQTAIQHNSMAIQLSRQMGIAEAELFSLVWKCWVQFLQGNYIEFEQLMERGRYLAGLIGYSGAAGLGFHALESVECYGRREVARVLDILHDTYEQARQAHSIGWAIITAQFLAETLINEGKWTEAEQILTGVMQIAEQERVFIPDCYLAIIYSLENKLSAAHAMVEKVRDAAGKNLTYFDQFYLSFAEASLACCEARWDDAWQHFDKAYEVAEHFDYRWYAAVILQNRADALLERGEPGDPARARDLLEKTMVLYEKMHLPAWARLIENRLNKVRENLNDR
jgi:tetratricopeptide (TPR) repeat protein